jgi:hypothetical protein
MLDRREGVAVAAEFREKIVSVLQLLVAGTIGSSGADSLLLLVNG